MLHLHTIDVYTMEVLHAYGTVMLYFLFFISMCSQSY